MEIQGWFLEINYCREIQPKLNYALEQSGLNAGIVDCQSGLIETRSDDYVLFMKLTTSCV